MLRKRKYAKRLSQDETKKIIWSRIKLNHLFLWKSYNRQESWRAVAADAEVDIDLEALIKKWGNLQSVYKKLVKSPKGTGISGRQLTADNWPYFNDMHEWATEAQNMKYPYLLNIEDSKNDQNQEEVSSEELNNLEDSSSFSLVMSRAVTPSMLSTSSEGRSTRKKKKENLIEEIIERSKRIEKKINAINRGISAVLNKKYIVLDKSDTEEEY